MYRYTQGILLTLFIFILGGVKAKLAKRLARFDSGGNEKKKTQLKIQSFIQEPGTTRADTKPTITKHYSDTFNTVDRYNRLRSSIAYEPRAVAIEKKFFSSMIEIILLNSWALFNDGKYEKSGKDDETSLSDYITALITDYIMK
ncbi:MAG: hypothetical protein H0U71_08330 [Gammaproteobacteria bacterium]|nr:hypothetical protein [Gammaproteobacteria bacterium]